jgi:plastocyanin
VQRGSGNPFVKGKNLRARGTDWPRQKKEPSEITNMNTNEQTEENQPAPLRDAHYSSRRLCLWLATLLLATAGTATAATVHVDVGVGVFGPDSVTISPGDTVQWTWSDSMFAHSVTSGSNHIADGLFNSGTRSQPFTFSFTFPNAGTFEYFCIPHFSMGMVGVVHVSGSAVPSTLGNISTRLRVQSGDNALIGGLIATGTAGKRVLIRAIGPSLIPFGVTGALANPTLDLFQGSTLLFSNDDWQNSPQQADIANSGLAPSNNLEAAIIQTLTPGQNYTAIVRGINGTTGVGIVEAYDLDQAVASKLGNISTRGFVDVDDNVMIAGLIAGPSNGASLKILVRALGPTLSDFGVTGALANPTLDLVNSSGTVIRSNDNWKNDPLQRAQIEAAGLAPAHDEEAALVETVAPGSYTAVVRGNNRTTGVGLVEAYNIP